MNNNAVTYQYLKFIDFQVLSTWDVKRYLSTSLKSSFSIDKLGKHIKEENNKIFPKRAPEKDFEILGVNNKTGIFDAYIQKGKEIKQPYKIVENGFLAYNPYRINVGSIGLKLSEHQYKYISPAYVVFSCKSNLLPEFLFLMFKTERFNQIIKDSTTGSVRQNLSFTNLSDIEIPLPTLPEQEKLVNEYQDKLQLAEQLKSEANNLEQDVEIFLLNALGVEYSKNNVSKTGRLYFVDFKDIERWDILNLLSSNIKLDSKFDICNINNIVHPINYDLEGKSLRFESKRFPKSYFNYIGMENIEKEKGILNEFQFLSGDKIKSQTIKVPLGFSIYGKLRPYLNKYWLNKSEKDNIICSSEFFVFKTKDSKVNDMFFNYLVGSTIIQKQIMDKFSGVRMPRIGVKDFLDLKFPLPPLKIQNKIVITIEEMKQNQSQKIKQAERLRTEAIVYFENAIFG